MAAGVSLLDRAARAALDEFGMHLEEVAPGADDEIARRTVRAVLLAIRDIDLDTQDDIEIAMLSAGRAQLPEHDEPLQADALSCWKAMIDAMI